jgi:sugar O-acyltransferase (sialic acid O-acetyltransferase NeuD family)
MDVLIVGAGGHGKVVLDILRAEGHYRPIGFLDADPALTGSSVHGLPILGQINLLPKLRQKAQKAIVAIGDNRTRASYADLVRQQGWDLVSAIHPTASVSPTATLGINVVVAAGAVVGTDAELADNVIINTAAVVDHECQIGNAAHICPAAALAGRVRVGEMAFVGLGCRVIQCLTIGSQSTIGAGAVVLEDVPEYATVVGVPARVVKVGRAAREPAELCPV